MLTYDQLAEAYRRVLRIRLFEEQAVSMVTSGELAGGVHPSIGQEAAVVGTCLAVRSDDYMLGTHRSHGHPIGKGAALGPLFAELLGKSTGVCHGKGGSMHLADFSVGSLGESSIVASGLPIAAGAALSAKLRGTDQVCIAFFGDGASNEGAFHEAVNLSAIWKLPVIWVCENNGYAITTSAKAVVPVERISQRAAAYGIPGVTVDGQDVGLVYGAVSEAVGRARRGEGPSIVELLTYRYLEHAEGMPIQTVYRPKDEIEGWRRRDPVALLAAAMQEEGFQAADLDGIRAEIEQEIGSALAFARSGPLPEASDAYSDLFVEEKETVRS
jgi:TPP-dependent pyruvate/acetoin dehydrogenase alpha subunit